jgi:hypothetical protein
MREVTSTMRFIINIHENILYFAKIAYNKDGNKSFISNEFSLKNDLPPLLEELFCGGKN